MGKPYSIDLRERVQAEVEAAVAAWRSSTLRCQCKLCGEAGRPCIANGIRRAGATRAAPWRRNWPLI